MVLNEYDDYNEYGDFCIGKINGGSGCSSTKSLLKKSRGGGKQNRNKTDAKKNKQQEVYSSKHVRIATEKQKKQKKK